MSSPDPIWQNGLCDCYALALLDRHPHLRLGGAGSADFGPQHWFAHDERYAYDSLGAHPLPHLGIDGQFDTVWSEQDPEWWGLPENGGEDDIARASAELALSDPVLRRPFDGSHAAERVEER
jgi:hypothetical protein